MILFYSSDANALFKKDILTVLSLPTNQSVHFRYSQNFVAPDLLATLSQQEGREALIVYVKNNNPDIHEDQRVVHTLPIRRAIIIRTRIDEHTQLVHFSLQLEEFITCDVAYPADPGKIPPRQFVSHADLKTFTRISWHKKIEELVNFDNNFQESLFYYVQINKTKNGGVVSIDPRFDPYEEASYFKISEGRPYQLDLSIYISETNADDFEKYECKLEYNQKDFVISNPSSIIIGTQMDNRRYKLVTKTIDTVKSFDYLKLIAQKTDGSTVTQFYETLLRFHVRKSRSRALLFVFYILLSVFGTALVATSRNKVGDYLIGQICVGVAFAVGAALGLYYHFNKRG